MRLLRPERSFKERSVRGNPECFPLRLHRGWRAIGNQDAQHEILSPRFSPGLPGNGGNGQDRRTVEWWGNVSSRPPSFVRFLSCVRSRDLWSEAARADRTSAPRHMGVYDILRMTAKAIQNRGGID